MPPGAPTPPGVTSEADARQLAMLAHILNFIFFVPLILYFVKKGQNAFLDSQAKEASNFALTCLIAHVAIDAIEITLRIPLLGCVLGLASLAIIIIQLILGIQNGLKARDGVATTYPFRFEFLK